MAIPNKYKNILNDFMDSSDAESRKAPRFESTLMGARPDLEEDYLNKDGNGQRGEKSLQKGKKRRVVRKDSSSEASVYYQ